jgi:TolA-binding protein
LDFELRQGKIGLSVAKLPLGGRLQVISGETIIRVVGTAFSVEREDDCVTVAVTEGIVEVRNDSVMDMLNAGEERTLCNSLDETLPQPTAAPMPTETPPSPVISDSATDEAPSRHRQKATRPNFTALSGDTASPTPEEALFMEAQSVLNRGDAADADEVFEQYLQVYPSGVFSEDALFHLTKTAYRRGAYDEVCARGERFLDRYDRASLPRQAQVRILCAKVQISKQHAPTKAWETISPLENEVDELSPQLQKQMISLLLKSACGANRPEACRRWAREYHDRYPNGALAEMAGDEVID